MFLLFFVYSIEIEIDKLRSLDVIYKLVLFVDLIRVFMIFWCIWFYLSVWGMGIVKISGYKIEMYVRI